MVQTKLLVCLKGDGQQSYTDAYVPLNRLLQVTPSPLLHQQVIKAKYQKVAAVLILLPEYSLCHDTWSSAGKWSNF